MFPTRRITIDHQFLTKLLEEVKQGQLSIPQALNHLKSLPFRDLGFAKVDHHRPLRTGFPEVVLGQGKTPHQVSSICVELAQHSEVVLVTRANNDMYEAVRSEIPNVHYDPVARLIVLDQRQLVEELPGITVVSGGTADLPTAEEAVVTAQLMGSQVERIYDIGIAGVHRLFHHLPEIQEANVLVAVAGMEGALPSLIAGLVSCPVIAVPTSTGYGASLEGLTPLMAMLTSCAAGMAVVNIDNGFGAGYLAATINRLAHRSENK